VDAIKPTNPDRYDSATRTLGDVLYAGPTRARVPEADWVALVNAIAAGDQLALRSLYGRTHRLVFTLIMRVVGNRQTAEELTVDVFHGIWQRAGGYDPSGGTVVGWIMNQARSRAIDRVRFENRKKRTNSHQPASEDAADGLDGALELNDRARLLREALAALTPDERQAIETAFFCEYTYAEAAERLNQPLGTVKTRIRSGLTKLRRVLGPVSEEP
jgi:RNA polymerase sigma-70 factor (ECF subfamily)